MFKDSVYGHPERGALTVVELTFELERPSLFTLFELDGKRHS